MNQLALANMRVDIVEGSQETITPHVCQVNIREGIYLVSHISSQIIFCKTSIKELLGHVNISIILLVY